MFSFLVNVLLGESVIVLFAGDSASSAVVVIMWCCEGECGASTIGKQDACAAAGEFCLLLVNVLLEYTALVLLLWL